MEDSEIDKDGFFRIRFNPDYEEKHWTKKNPVIFEILRGIIAIGVAVAINFLISEKRIDKLEQQVSILQHKLEKATA
ncbi:MAG TPA: hypothetical protein VL098_05105 [Flavipsychrobacter sp.]|nr:hypothetical protein [Flavipsychrobacter sp.]